MDRSQASNRPEGSVLSLLGACATLVAVLAVVGVGFGFYGDYRYGAIGVRVAFLAVGICSLAGCLALAVSFAGKRCGCPLQGVLASMLVRLGLPLIAGVVLQRASPSLAAAGVFGMIVGNYLCMLVVETCLSLKFVSPFPKPMTKAA